MAKSLSERIAERMRTKRPTGAAKNRAAFLAVRSDVKTAMDDGWPVKVIWETLREEGKISFGYDAFISYVNQLIRKSYPVEKAMEVLPAKKETAVKANVSGIAGFTFDATPRKEDLL